MNIICQAFVYSNTVDKLVKSHLLPKNLKLTIQKLNTILK